MKPPKDAPKTSCISYRQREGQVAAAHGDDEANTRSPVSDRSAQQHFGHMADGAAEEDKFDDLVKMCSHVTHQANNLLTTVLANAQLVLLLVGNDELESYLGIVERAARDAGALMREFQVSFQTLAETPSQDHDSISGIPQRTHAKQKV